MNSRRRHSQLFQRMQMEIKRISNHLSAAKKDYSKNYTHQNNLHSHFKSFGSTDSKSIPTARKEKILNFKQTKTPSPETEITKCRTTPMRKRQSSCLQPTPVQSKTLKMSGRDQYLDPNRILLKLHEDNAKINYELGRCEQTCEDKCYKIGFLKAELRETQKKLDFQFEKQEKQNYYLSTLVQFYKNKAKKYKKILCGTSQISTDDFKFSEE